MKTVLLDQTILDEIKVIEDTQYVIFDFCENEEKLIKKEKSISLNLVFEKSGVSAEILGIFCLAEENALKVQTSSKHIAPNTSCNTYIKSVLNDGSSFDYRGKIIIEKTGRQTSAYLNDNALVVGENTRRNSQPTLEIEANDVKASHGSTTGRINEEQLYYLESRGLSRSQAEEIIKEGFLTDLVDGIKDENIREKLLNKLKSKGEEI